MNETQTAAEPQAASTGVPAVTLVTTTACHFCEDAHAVLNGLAAQGRITLTLVAADTPLGGRLLATHRPAMFPLVLVSGRFFSGGRLPRRKLERLLAKTGPC